MIAQALFETVKVLTSIQNSRIVTEAEFTMANVFSVARGIAS